MVEALVTNFYVQLDGSDASADFMQDVDQITVESSLHLPDVATVVVHDTELKWIDDDSVKPGVGLKISVKGGSSDEDLFDGEIVELEPDFSTGTHWLTIRAFNRLHRLARGRYVRTFQNVSDGDIVSKIAGALGLQSSAGDTPGMFDYVIQANETNLDFLRGRAAARGFVLFVRGKTLHFEKPQSDGAAIQLEWGDTLHEFHPRLTTVDQVDNVTVRGWSRKEQQAVVGTASSGEGTPEVGTSTNGGSVAQEAYNLSAPGLITNRPVRIQDDATRMAQADLDRRLSRFLEAQGTCDGDGRIKAGSKLTISKVGTKFGGTYLVTSATHRYSPGTYTTDFSVTGRHPDNLLSLLMPDLETAPLTGPVIGKVTNNKDPEGQGRVKVKFPWLSDDEESDWAPVVAPMAGSSRGFQFLPEVNDEVLVDFELGDINYPYVLGALWNGQDGAPKQSTEAVGGDGKVNQRIIQTRAGHQILFDDMEGAAKITIQGKNGNKIVIDSADAGGGISIEDKNGNKAAIDTVTNSMTIQVNGNLTLQASQGQVQIKGLTISIEAEAMVEIKGGLIKLN